MLTVAVRCAQLRMTVALYCRRTLRRAAGSSLEEPVTQRNYYASGAIPPVAPDIAPRAPEGEGVTEYDRGHFLTYARLIDAETGGFDWRESAAVILGLDVERDVLAAQSCWKSHLARAHWIATTGYRLLLIEAGLSEGE
jgi:hypothetical protein